MKHKIFRQFLTLFISYALVYTPILRADQNSVATDIIAPEISQEKYQDTLSSGVDHNIIVNVKDNVSVHEVILHYRVIYTETYESVSMQNLAGTDEYQASIFSEKIKSPGIEYYVEAVDTAGNSVLHGYPFSPISAKIVNDATEADSLTTEVPSEEEESSNTWLWIGLGVLVAGAAFCCKEGREPPGEPQPTQTGSVNITW